MKNQRSQIIPYIISRKISLRVVWTPLLLFATIVASGIVSFDYFFDTLVLPKQLLTCFLAGFSAFFVAIHFWGGKKLSFSLLDQLLFLFLVYFGILFVFQNDTYCLLNLLLLIVVYTLCRQSFRVTIERTFIVGIFICGCYSSLVSLKQFSEGNNVNGGYDTSSGFGLILVFLFVFCQNWLCKYKNNAFLHLLLISFFVIIFILLSMRTAIIAICCTTFIMKIHKYKFLIAFVGATIIFFMSIRKSESTTGRMFIYKTSLSLLDTPRNILFGRGAFGFRQSYMQRQAKMLKKESNTTQYLADNIKHPLNEFLLLVVNYGALLLVACLIFFMFILKGTHDTLSKSIYLTIIVFSSFTYPFHYPITYIMIAFALSRAMYHISTRRIIRINNLHKMVSITFILIGLWLTITSVQLCVWNVQWKKAYAKNNFGIIDCNLSEYTMLANSRYVSNEFYYNWAYLLMVSRRTEDAINVISECKIIDYDTQMLKANLCTEKGDMNLALSFFQEASEMCPNRFMPLYAQFKLYDAQKMYPQRNRIGRIILAKEEKVSSETIIQIKKEVNETLYVKHKF